MKGCADGVRVHATACGLRRRRGVEATRFRLRANVSGAIDRLVYVSWLRCQYAVVVNTELGWMGLGLYSIGHGLDCIGCEERGVSGDMIPHSSLSW